MKLWKASTASSTQNRPLISRQIAWPRLSFVGSASVAGIALSGAVAGSVRSDNQGSILRA